MIYLTAQHETPPSVITLEGTQYPVTRMIELDDAIGLAAIGVYQHITAEGDAPLGYTDWALVDGQYVREPAGTEAERNAALLKQKWVFEAQAKKQRDAEKLLAQPIPDQPSASDIEARIQALRIL